MDHIKMNIQSFIKSTKDVFSSRLSNDSKVSGWSCILWPKLLNSASFNAMSDSNFILMLSNLHDDLLASESRSICTLIHNYNCKL